MNRIIPSVQGDLDESLLSMLFRESNCLRVWKPDCVVMNVAAATAEIDKVNI